MKGFKMVDSDALETILLRITETIWQVNHSVGNHSLREQIKNELNVINYEIKSLTSSKK